MLVKCGTCGSFTHNLYVKTSGCERRVINGLWKKGCENELNELNDLSVFECLKQVPDLMNESRKALCR